ncbi:MAG: hypothetical protein NT165_02770 [Candidatus Falkowbacteria bacterium]|nr:hypothetical protein [Candidatus Falkowbacteria bacterium]
MPAPKKSSSTSNKVVKKVATKKPLIKKTVAKKPVKRVVKPKPILSHAKESGFKKFVEEQNNYHPEDSFVAADDFKDQEAIPELPQDQEAIEQPEEISQLMNEESNEDGQTVNQEAPYNREDYDFQRKFYHSLALEAKERGEAELPNHSRIRSVSFYRKFAIRFTLAVMVLIAIVAFFSFSKLTISVVPNEDLVNESLSMSVQDEGASSTMATGNVAKGIVRSLVIEDEKIFSATGEESVSSDFSGKVFIINKNNKAQALVATTRLLSSDNKLFRIKNAVNVPAGGEVEVDVYPDQASPEMAIAPSNFIIPGLNASLQQKIYAESRGAFSFNSGTKKYISAEDLSNAKKDLSLALMEKAKTEASTQFQQYDKIIYNVDITKIVTATDAKPGDNKDEFKMKARGSVQVIAFSQSEALKLVAGKLKVSVPEGKVLSGLNESSISYSLENADEVAKVATVKVSFSGRTTLAPGVEIVDRNKIVNLNRDQINDYLKTIDSISAYKLEFSPSFISKAPSLSDRIKVEIVNPTSTESTINE